MLFNPRWLDPHTKCDPFGLDTLIEWLEHQPSKEYYDYRNCHGCLLAQYFREQGFMGVEVSKNFVTQTTGKWVVGTKQELLPEFFNWIAEERPHNFGAASRRAKIAQTAPKDARARVLGFLNARLEAEDCI